MTEELLLPSPIPLGHLQLFGNPKLNVNVATNSNSRFHRPSLILPRRQKKHSLPIKIKTKTSSRKIKLSLTQTTMKKILMRQVLANERSLMKLTATVLLYRNFLENVSSSSSCPICSSKLSKQSSKFLNNKLTKEVNLFTKLVYDSPQFKSKERLLRELGDVPEYLSESRAFLEGKQQTVKGVRELRVGERDSLLLLRAQLVKTKSCPICEKQVKPSEFGKVLGNLDKRTLQTSLFL